MALKQPYLNKGNNRVANYGRDLEQRPGRYRVEWTSPNGYQGHGEWTTYLNAKIWVNFMNKCHPEMIHKLGQIVEQESMDLD